MMHNFQNNKILMFDGAMGTALMARGLKADCMESFNLSHFSDLVEISKGYILAGADVLETNTFGANAFKLTQHGLADKLEEIIFAAVNAVKEAKKQTGSKAKICASIGPTGELAYPMGSFTFQNYYDAFFPQAKAIYAAGVDCLLIETFSSLFEAKCAYLAARAAAPNIPVGISFVFENDRTLFGMTPEIAAIAATNLGANFLGTNCSSSPLDILSVVKKYREFTALPLLAMPNAGLPEVKDGTLNFPLSAEEFSSYAEELVKSGINMAGGCCGTTANDEIEQFFTAISGMVNCPLCFDVKKEQIETADRYYNGTAEWFID